MILVKNSKVTVRDDHAKFYKIQYIAEAIWTRKEREIARRMPEV